MKGKSVFRESRELAFDAYCESGGNKAATLKKLEKEGLKLSRPTLDDWIEKFHFVDRLKENDLARQKAVENQMSFEEKLMSRLIDQLEAYNEWFKTKPDIDNKYNQAVYAQANLIKVMIELSRRLKPTDKLPEGQPKAGGLSDETLARIKEEIYGITPNKDA